MPAAGMTVAAGVGGVAAAGATVGGAAVEVAAAATDTQTGAGGNRSVYYGSSSSCFNCGSERLRRKYVAFCYSRPLRSFLLRGVRLHAAAAPFVMRSAPGMLPTSWSVW